MPPGLLGARAKECDSGVTGNLGSSFAFPHLALNGRDRATCWHAVDVRVVGSCIKRHRNTIDTEGCLIEG